MLAIDTNLIVRYLTNDHPEQSQLARNVIEGHTVFVALTVLLETEWVLRAAYGFSPYLVAAALRAFAGLPMVKIEDQARVERAIAWMEAGLDFADALHLAGAGHCDGFATFDHALEKAAKAVNSVEIRRL